jgi:hypothetical protein
MNCLEFNKFLDYCAFSFFLIIGKAGKIILLKKAAKKNQIIAISQLSVIRK